MTNNVPIQFKTIDIVRNDNLYLSYSFDVLNSIETSEGDLPLKQQTMIKALHIGLGGKTSNPNISIGLDGETNLFTLEKAYLTDTYPHLKDTKLDMALVIEGYSIQNVTKERVLIFLPMTKTTETNTLFYPFEQAIVNKSPIKGFTFDEYIPESNMDTDYYTYYPHTDSDGVLFHILYFAKSRLQYTTALKNPFNDKNYNASLKIANFRSASLPKRHDNMTTNYEDNIYIDCVPVGLENEKVLKYMQVSDHFGSYYADMLTYLVYIVILSLVVYAIYWFHLYNSRTGASPG